MELLTLGETLARTSLPRRTLFRLRERGEFVAPLTIGSSRNIYFRADEVDAWLRANPPAPRTHRDP